MNIQACGATQVCLGQVSYVGSHCTGHRRLIVSWFTDAQQHSEILCRVSPSKKHCYQEVNTNSWFRTSQLSQSHCSSPNMNQNSPENKLYITILLSKFLLSLIKCWPFPFLSDSLLNICIYFSFLSANLWAFDSFSHHLFHTFFNQSFSNTCFLTEIHQHHQTLNKMLCNI